MAAGANWGAGMQRRGAEGCPGRQGKHHVEDDTDDADEAVEQGLHKTTSSKHVSRTFIKHLFFLSPSVFTYPENGTDDFRDQAKNLNHQVFMAA